MKTYLLMKNFLNDTNRACNVLSKQLQKLWRCAMVLAAAFAFSANAFAQDLPAPARCTSEDLQVIGATLTGTGCVTCELGDALSSTITFTIQNTTQSLRTSYAYWGTVVVKDAQGNVIGNPIPISGCNSDGFPGGSTRSLVDATTINYVCGNQVEVINFYGAWTDASDNENRQCPLDPSKIAPKCDVVPVLPIRTPVVAVAGDDFTITCVLNPNGKQIGESPQAGFTYSWSPSSGLSAANISNPIANPSSTTTYTVTKTRTVDNCSDTDQVTVTVNNAAVTAFAGEDFTKTCSSNPNGKQIGEASDAAFTYSWVPTAGLSDPNISNPVANPSGTTTYTVTKTNTVTGCFDTDEIVVDVDIAPQGAPGGPDVERCGPGTVTLAVANPLGGVTYRWFDAASNGTLLHTGSSFTTGNLTQTTSFWVSATGANSCSSTLTEIKAIIKDEAIAIAGGPYVVTCTEPRSVTLAGSFGGGASSGSWSVPAGMGSVTGSVYTPSAAALDAGAPVVLTYTTNNPDGPCDAASAQATVTFDICVTDEGCTPGYWKQAQHFGNWGCDYIPTGVNATQFFSVFTGITNRQGLSVSLTLLQALNLNGGKFQALARHAAAAILNACSDINYQYSEAQVKAMVVAAFNTGNFSTALNNLVAANERDCPLGRAELTSSNTQTLEGVKADRFSVYPTPFSDKATIEFTISKTENYVVNLYDMKGTLVKQLKAGTAKAGQIERVEVDGNGLGEGLYIARMVSDSGARSVKLLLKRE